MKSKKTHWKTIVYAVVVGVLFFTGIYFILPGFVRMNSLARQESKLQECLYDKENMKSQLESCLNGLQNDPVMVEKVARDEMGMSKENEIIYKFDR